MPTYSSEILLQDTYVTIGELIRAFKLYSFYSADHPATVDLIKKISVHLSQLTSEGPWKLNLSKDQIFLGAVSLDNKKQNIMEFCNHLNKRRIYSLTLLSGLTDEETGVLIRILAMDPKQIRRGGGVRKQLMENQITHIDLSEYLYDESITIGKWCSALNICLPST